MCIRNLIRTWCPCHPIVHALATDSDDEELTLLKLGSAASAEMGHAVVRTVETQAYEWCDDYVESGGIVVSCYPTAPICPNGELEDEYLDFQSPRLCDECVARGCPSNWVKRSRYGWASYADVRRARDERRERENEMSGTLKKAQIKALHERRLALAPLRSVKRSLEEEERLDEDAMYQKKEQDAIMSMFRNEAKAAPERRGKEELGGGSNHNSVLGIPAQTAHTEAPRVSWHKKPGKLRNKRKKTKRASKPHTSADSSDDYDSDTEDDSDTDTASTVTSCSVATARPRPRSRRGPNLEPDTDRPLEAMESRMRDTEAKPTKRDKKKKKNAAKQDQSGTTEPTRASLGARRVKAWLDGAASACAARVSAYGRGPRPATDANINGRAGSSSRGLADVELAHGQEEIEMADLAAPSRAGDPGSDFEVLFEDDDESAREDNGDDSAWSTSAGTVGGLSASSAWDATSESSSQTSRSSRGPAEDKDAEPSEAREKRFGNRCGIQFGDFTVE